MPDTTKLIDLLHQDAMNYAEKAILARRRGQHYTASAAFRRAFELEDRAARMAVDWDVAEPSRSILIDSAASLARECKSPRVKT